MTPGYCWAVWSCDDSERGSCHSACALPVLLCLWPLEVLVKVWHAYRLLPYEDQGSILLSSSAWSQLYLQNRQVPWEAVFSPLGCSSLPGLRFAFACCLDVFKQIYFMFPCDFSRICFFLEFVVIKFFLELIGYTVFNRCLEGYFSARLRKKLDIFIVICKYLNRSHFRNILKIGKINI